MKIILFNSDMSHPDLDHRSDCLFSQFWLYLKKCLLQLELRRTCPMDHKNSQILSHSVTAWISTLDKLLGQLGIYATWLSSIAYLQKQLRIFIFFMSRFFFCDYTFSYYMNPSRMCLHIYSLPSSAFLKYQTSGFYCT